MLNERDKDATFFDLPIELREIVYRRSRFLECRRRVAELLGPGRLQRRLYDGNVNQMDISGQMSIEVELIISPTKRMVVRQTVYHDGSHRVYRGVLFDTVEVVDEGRVNVVLDGSSGKVTLLIGTQFKNTAAVHRINGGDTTIWQSTSWWMYDRVRNMNVQMQSLGWTNFEV